MRKITKTRILSMVLAGAMAVGICTPFGKISNVYAEQTNAIPNPGFEDGQLPWYVTADEDGLDTGILTEEGTGNKLAYLNIKEKLAMDYNSKVL